MINANRQLTTPLPHTGLKPVTRKTTERAIGSVASAADEVVQTGKKVGQAAKHVPFFKPSHLAKVGLSGMLLDVPFVGWNYKDGEISAKQVVGKLAASPLNWIAFEGAMRLPARWLPNLKGSPLGIAAGLTAGMLASGLYEKFVGNRIADAVAKAVPESVANPVAETAGTIAEYLDNSIWEPALGKVIRPAMDAATQHPLAAAGIGLATSAALHRPLPKLSGFVLGNVTGISGIVGIQKLPFGHHTPTVVMPEPTKPSTPITVTPTEAQTLYADGRISTLVDRGGHRLLTPPQQVQLIKRLAAGITSGASEKRIMRIFEDAAQEGRLDGLLQGVNNANLGNTVVGSLLDMRKIRLLTLVTSAPGVSGHTAQTFLSQVRDADITENLQVAPATYEAYGALVQDFRNRPAAELEAAQASWPPLVAKLPASLAGPVCEQALARQDLSVAAKLALLRAIRPDVAKTLGVGEAVTVLEQALAQTPHAP